MLEPKRVSSLALPRCEESPAFPAEAFERFSKSELLTLLDIMHRILDADRKRDLERLVTQLPLLFPQDRGLQNEIDEQGKPFEASSLKGEQTYRVFHYVFACLAKAQARMETTTVPHFPINKQPCQLSPRELTVLLWMKEGKTNWEIARILGLSERTVRFHVGSIFEKLDVTSRTQAVARALGTGLIAS